MIYLICIEIKEDVPRDRKTMKKSTKIIITISAVAAVTAALAAVSKYFCDFAMGTGEKSFRINDSLGSEGNEYKNTLHERRNNYREWMLNRSENIYLLTNDGVKVHALLTEHEEKTHRYAIICHGYKNTSDDMGYQAFNFYNMGYNVLAPDGRASGKTAGKHIGMGWLERRDLLGYINFIIARDNHAEIVLYGVSMGAAEVMMAAGEKMPDNVKAIVEDCGYTSVWDEFAVQLKHVFKLPSVPLLNIVSAYSKLVHGFGFREASAVNALKRCKLPILMIHGTEDNFVPYSMLDKLYNAAAGEKEKLVIEGASHLQSDIIAPEIYWSTIEKFISKYVRA